MTRGMVLGKFLPPHQGHAYLIGHAAAQVDELVIVVDPVFSERIPVSTRMAWMRQSFPYATVITLKQILPQFPHEAPENFWPLWEQGLKEVLPGPVDVVFASEDYGETLASILQARFEMVDSARKTVPISATMIRENPYRYWDLIAEAARPFYCKKVCIFGPESVGKSTLTEQLATHFNTAFVPEYARTLIEENQGRLHYEDMEKIAQGHAAAIRHALPHANKVLFVDTDVITTKIWSKELFGKYPVSLDALIAETSYDLYLLLDVDVPWVPDIVRFRPEAREAFMATCLRELEMYDRNFVLISGNWEARLQQAVHSIHALLNTEVCKL